MLPGKDDRNDISAPPAMEEGEETDPRIATLEQFGIVPGAVIYDREFGGTPQTLTIEIVDESGVEWSGGTFGGGKTTLDDALEAVNMEEWVSVEKYIQDSPLLPLTPPKSPHSKFLGIVETLLNEVSFEDAKKSLFSKSTKKIIRNFNYNSGKDPDDMMDSHLSSLSEKILDNIPDDIEDKQKALSLLWILKIVKESRDYARIVRKLSSLASGNVLAGDLEMFFHHQRFMDEKDLMKIESFDELDQVVRGARDDIENYQQQKDYEEAGAGTEVLRGTVEEDPVSGRLELKLDDGIGIIAIHNKGAACHWGRKTDWCTATDLDYFDQYYQPDDPLFYFVDKEWAATEGSSGRYQFHYGTQQFMDENDNPVHPDVAEDLSKILRDTKAFEKYPRFKQYIIRNITEDASELWPQWKVDKKEIHSVIDSMSDDLKRSLASNREARPESLDYLVQTSKDPNLLIKIIGNDTATDETLERLINYNPDEEDDVGTMPHWLSSRVDIAEEGGIALIARRELFYRALHKKSRLGKWTSAGQEGVDKYSPLVDETGKSDMLRYAPPEAAIQFAKDKSAKVRAGVAKNARLPLEVLRDLSENDPDKTVRENAVESLRKRGAYPDAMNPEGEEWKPGMPTPMAEGRNKDMKHLMEIWDKHLGDISE